MSRFSPRVARKLVFAVLTLAVALAIFLALQWNSSPDRPVIVADEPPRIAAPLPLIQKFRASPSRLSALDGVSAEASPERVALEHALATAPTDARILGDLSDLERQLGRIWSALEHAQAAEAMQPTDPLNAVRVGELLSALRAFPEARAAYDRALALAPDRVDWIARKAVTYQAEGDLASAEALLSALPSVAPKDAALIAARRRQLMYQGKYAEALQLVDTIFGNAAKAKTANGWVRLLFHIDIGQLRQLMGHAGTANLEFQLALHLDGELRAVQFDAQKLGSVLALTHAGLGNQDAAIKAAQAAITAASTDYPAKQAARLQLAQILAQFGDSSAALLLLEDSLAQPFGMTRAALRLDPAWMALRDDPRFEALSADAD